MITLIDAIKKAKKIGYDYVTIDPSGEMYAFKIEPEFMFEDYNLWDTNESINIHWLGSSKYCGGKDCLLNINELTL